jgi:hypothetical protein
MNPEEIAHELQDYLAERQQELENDQIDGHQFYALISGAIKTSLNKAARYERHAIVTKLCTEHISEDDLIKWIESRK